MSYGERMLKAEQRRECGEDDQVIDDVMELQRLSSGHIRRSRPACATEDTHCRSEGNCSDKSHRRSCSTLAPHCRFDDSSRSKHPISSQRTEDKSDHTDDNPANNTNTTDNDDCMIHRGNACERGNPLTPRKRTLPDSQPTPLSVFAPSLRVMPLCVTPTRTTQHHQQPSPLPRRCRDEPGSCENANRSHGADGMEKRSSSRRHSASRGNSIDASTAVSSARRNDAHVAHVRRYARDEQDNAAAVATATTQASTHAVTKKPGLHVLRPAVTKSIAHPTLAQPAFSPVHTSSGSIMGLSHASCESMCAGMVARELQPASTPFFAVTTGASTTTDPRAPTDARIVPTHNSSAGESNSVHTASSPLSSTTSARSNNTALVDVRYRIPPVSPPLRAAVSPSMPLQHLTRNKSTHECSYQHNNSSNNNDKAKPPGSANHTHHNMYSRKNDSTDGMGLTMSPYCGTSAMRCTNMSPSSMGLSLSRSESTATSSTTNNSWHASNKEMVHGSAAEVTRSSRRRTNRSSSNNITRDNHTTAQLSSSSSASSVLTQLKESTSGVVHSTSTALPSTQGTQSTDGHASSSHIHNHNKDASATRSADLLPRPTSPHHTQTAPTRHDRSPPMATATVATTQWSPMQKTISHKPSSDPSFATTSAPSPPRSKPDSRYPHAAHAFPTSPPMLPDYSGFCNDGNDCYACSVLTLLLRSVQFRQALWSAPCVMALERYCKGSGSTVHEKHSGDPNSDRERSGKHGRRSRATQVCLSHAASAVAISGYALSLPTSSFASRHHRPSSTDRRHSNDTHSVPWTGVPSSCVAVATRTLSDKQDTVDPRASSPPTMSSSSSSAAAAAAAAVSKRSRDEANDKDDSAASFCSSSASSTAAMDSDALEEMLEFDEDGYLRATLHAGLVKLIRAQLFRERLTTYVNSPTLPPSRRRAILARVLSTTGAQDEDDSSRDGSRSRSRDSTSNNSEGEGHYCTARGGVTPRGRRHKENLHPTDSQRKRRKKCHSMSRSAVAVEASAYACGIALDPIVHLFDGEFFTGEQEDAHELLVCLLAKLEEEAMSFERRRRDVMRARRMYRKHRVYPLTHRGANNENHGQSCNDSRSDGHQNSEDVEERSRDDVNSEHPRTTTTLHDSSQLEDGNHDEENRRDREDTSCARGLWINTLVQGRLLNIVRCGNDTCRHEVVTEEPYANLSVRLTDPAASATSAVPATPPEPGSDASSSTSACANSKSSTSVPTLSSLLQHSMLYECLDGYRCDRCGSSMRQFQGGCFYDTPPPMLLVQVKRFATHYVTHPEPSSVRDTHTRKSDENDSLGAKECNTSSASQGNAAALSSRRSSSPSTAPSSSSHAENNDSSPTRPSYSVVMTKDQRPVQVNTTLEILSLPAWGTHAPAPRGIDMHGRVAFSSCLRGPARADDMLSTSPVLPQKTPGQAEEDKAHASAGSLVSGCTPENANGEHAGAARAAAPCTRWVVYYDEEKKCLTRAVTDAELAQGMCERKGCSTSSCSTMNTDTPLASAAAALLPSSPTASNAESSSAQQVCARATEACVWAIRSLYRLQGSVLHMGQTLSCGHYVCEFAVQTTPPATHEQKADVVRQHTAVSSSSSPCSSPLWKLANDASVHDMTEDDKTHAEQRRSMLCYLVLYEKVYEELVLRPVWQVLPRPSFASQS